MRIKFNVQHQLRSMKVRLIYWTKM